MNRYLCLNLHLSFVYQDKYERCSITTKKNLEIFSRSHPVHQLVSWTEVYPTRHSYVSLQPIHYILFSFHKKLSLFLKVKSISKNKGEASSWCRPTWVPIWGRRRRESGFPSCCWTRQSSPWHPPRDWWMCCRPTGFLFSYFDVMLS